ncbi:MAG TPA: hypothetical protein VK617_14370 [Gemmatimonadaceae bacterium]|nr:hypothetical protein [Gemmatimonadaceae bacterium]
MTFQQIGAAVLVSTLVAMAGRATLEPPVAARALFLFCNPLTDTTGAIFLAKAQSYGASTWKVYVDSRSTLGIPSVPISQVLGVTDESKCQRASQAVDSINIGAPRGGRIVLGSCWDTLFGAARDHRRGDRSFRQPFPRQELDRTAVMASK